MKLDNNIQAFFELVQAGLWGKGDPDIRIDGTPDWNNIYRLAHEQSVLGLVLAGLELSKVKPPKEVLLQWIGDVQVIEQRNKAMNKFVAELIERLRKADIYAILVKGQGIAQCYEKPLWRSSGDVDLLLSEDNYEKAKNYLLPLASSVEQEFVFLKHLGMQISGWEVELHGSQRPRLTKKIDHVVDEVQQDVFYGGHVRSWMNGLTQVFLPGPDIDVIFVFTHILHHFYQEGVGLRQICDWCRLLYTYKNTLNVPLLESRLRKAGLMREWKAFAAFAVSYLGMPIEAMPLYSADRKWSRTANQINDFVMEVGNFGHSRNPKRGSSFFGCKLSSLWRRTVDSARHSLVFPKNFIKIWWHMVRTGLKVVSGE